MTIRCGRHFTKTSAATPAVMGEVIGKTKQQQMKPRELLKPRELRRPPRLPPLKTNDHHSPALRWSLFIFNIELRKISLEVGELNLMNLAVYYKTALHLMRINAMVRLSQIKKKRVQINLTIFSILIKH